MIQLPVPDDPEVDYFVEDVLPDDWDEKIYLRSIPEDLDWMEVIKPLPCGNGYIPVGFKYNGASSGIFAKVIILNFPKWKHRIATCRHDWRCELADTKEKRKIADEMFKKDILVGGTKWEAIKGYIGVRIGAAFKYGSPQDKKENPMDFSPRADELDIKTG